MIIDRNLTIDFIKGILIYLVVLGHIISGKYMNGLSLDIEESIRFIIYLFHMPLFFFFSGYLISIEKLKKVYILEKIKYIGIVFFVSSLIYMIVFSSISFKSIILMVSSPYNHLWFLEVLLIYLFLTYMLKSINYNLVISLSILLAILGTGLRDLGSTEFNQFGYKPIVRGIEYFIYFYLGYGIRNYLINYKILKVNSKYMLLLVIVFVSLTIINLTIDFTKIKFYISYSFGFVGLNIILILMTNKILSVDLENRYIVEGGRASLFIYLWHYGFVIIFLHLIDKYWYSNLFTDIFLSVFIFIFLILMNRIFSKYKIFNYLGAR